MSEAESYRTSSAAHAPEKVQKFADQMSNVHGCRVVLSREATGYHLYIPCPDCLPTHGKSELSDPKYAINVSKWLNIGDEDQRGAVTSLDARLNPEAKDEKSSICMRTRQSKQPHRFSVTQLLEMTTVTERHPELRTKAKVTGRAGSEDREEHWELDEAAGVMCPPPPGDVIPITELPDDHPAVQYLRGRGYDQQRLWDFCRCSFCYREYPHGVNGVYYRSMPGGWRDTPQNRIVFYSMHKGAPLTWQARGIEKLTNGDLDKFQLCPYPGWEPGADNSTLVWSHTHTRANHTSKWMPVPPFDQEGSDGVLKFQPSKYRTAKYSQREMMGWDAAIKRAAEDPDDIKWCVLCEGPLDGARVGPGGIPLIGSSISPENAEKVAANFHIAFTAFDEDKAGRGATEKVGRMLLSDRIRQSVMQLVVPLPIPTGKDIGEMAQSAFDAMLATAIKRTRRGI